MHCAALVSYSDLILDIMKLGSSSRRKRLDVSFEREPESSSRARLRAETGVLMGPCWDRRAAILRRLSSPEVGILVGTRESPVFSVLGAARLVAPSNGLGFEDNATYEPCCAQPGARARGSLVFDIEADSALSAQGRCALSTEAASPIEPQGEFVGPGP